MTKTGEKVNVCLRDVCFSYGKRTVLQNFSLSLPELSQGGIIAMSGASGCGKSTLLRLLAGLEQADSGEIICPSADRIALLFQDDRLLPRLNVAAQVAAVLPKGADVQPYLAAVELAGEDETMPDELSGGMRRRLALARALAYGRDKALLLLDEPFSGVDFERTERIMEKIRQMRKPVIYTAHGSDVSAMADRVVAMNDLLP